MVLVGAGNDKGRRGKKMEEMMELMMGKMSQDERQKIVEKMMGKFLDGMTADDKRKMMETMMPGMTEGVDMTQMMSRMMEGMMRKMSTAGVGQGEAGMPMMPQMMIEMMPKCLEMLLPRVPKEKRTDFVSTMVATLMEQGCAGMSGEEKRDFKAKVLEKL